MPLKNAPSPAIPDRILKAAIELIQQQGLQGLSQARIATAAGLRQSHLTYYFPTRKDLLKAIVQVIHSEVAQSMTTSIHPEANQAEQINMLRDFFCQCIREPLLARLILALMNAADEDPSLRDWLDQFDEAVIHRWRTTFTQLGLKVSENELALFHASIVGTAMMAARRPAPTTADHASRLAGLAFDRLIRP